jgi:predicted site-specific integrase-resolvase
MIRPDPQFYSAEKVCEILDIARSTLVEWDKKDITKPKRIGNLKRYLREDIEALGTERKYKRSGK